jgi:UDP-2-acetamido-3-amino-2,3-dideoxy-glucuronate N-acetyltransferase
MEREYFVHESAIVDSGAQIGSGTQVWHFSHISGGARIGKNCKLGQNVFVAKTAVLGDRVKVQNNVSIYDGIIVESEVFLGPSCVLTNVSNPRSQVNRKAAYENTLIRRGATIGANATVVCGVTLGRYCFVAAGAVVTRDVPDYALIVGVPGRQSGWMSRHGIPLGSADAAGVYTCPESGLRYREKNGVLHCLDLDEESPLPEELERSSESYRELKRALQLG